MNCFYFFEYIVIATLFLRHIDLFFDESIEFDFVKRFDEIVDDHLIDKTVNKINRSRFDLFAHEILLNIDMLRARVNFEIFIKSNSVLIVNINAY